jgi:hypothetical protein
VFALSAAIAGFAGALYAAQLQSVTPERFILFTSLSLFMLTVVGGIGNVSGALMGGVLLAVSVVAIPDTFTKLAHDYPSFDNIFNWLSDFTTLLPAIIGINLGKNPSGAVSDIVNGFEPLGRVKPAIVAMVALLTGTWFLAHQDVISNWWFVVLFAVIMIGVPRVAQTLKPEAFMTREQVYARRHETPLELVGIDRPFTPADRRMLDGALELGAGNGHATFAQHPLAFALASDRVIIDDIAGESDPEVVP